MKTTFALLLVQLFLIPGLLAGTPEDEVVVKPASKHHFNWLADAQPVIPVGNFTSHQSIGGPAARLFSPVTDSTYKFINTLYMGTFKGSAGYQYGQLFYVGLGAGVQFGRQLAFDTSKWVTDIMVPFYADMRVTYGGKIQVYYQQTTGYTLFFNQDFKQNDTLYFDAQHGYGVYRNNKPWGGFFMQSSLGGKINLKKLSVSAGVGYQLTYVVEKYNGFEAYNIYPAHYWFTFPYTTKEMRHSVLITLGLCF